MNKMFRNPKMLKLLIRKLSETYIKITDNYFDIVEDSEIITLY